MQNSAWGMAGIVRPTLLAGFMAYFFWTSVHKDARPWFLSTVHEKTRFWFPRIAA
jgi:hypothetical protein